MILIAAATRPIDRDNMIEEVVASEGTKGANGGRRRPKSVTGTGTKSRCREENIAGDPPPRTRSVSSSPPKKQVVPKHILPPLWYELLFTLLSFFWLIVYKNVINTTLNLWGWWLLPLSSNLRVSVRLFALNQMGFLSEDDCCSFNFFFFQGLVCSKSSLW